MERHQVVRLLSLLLAVALGGLGVLALARPWLPTGGAVNGFADQVAAACAVALVGCWAWLALGTVVVAAQSLTRLPMLSGRRLSWVPGAVRALIPVVLGAAVTAAPAGATPAHEPGTSSTASSPAPAAPAGLPLPDRAPTSPGRDRTVVVRAGDSLWSIAARLLPASAPDTVVDAAWRRLAGANAARVPDPHLILPGTRLRVPPTVHPSSVHPREEAP